LHSYYHSSNPTQKGALAIIYLLAEVNTSIATATTPLLKSFILEFKVIGQQRAVAGVLQANPEADDTEEDGDDNQHHESPVVRPSDQIESEKSRGNKPRNESDQLEGSHVNSPSEDTVSEQTFKLEENK
jgi:hypothetical protein